MRKQREDGPPQLLMRNLRAISLNRVGPVEPDCKNCQQAARAGADVMYERQAIGRREERENKAARRSALTL